MYRLVEGQTVPKQLSGNSAEHAFEALNSRNQVVASTFEPLGRFALTKEGDRRDLSVWTPQVLNYDHKLHSLRLDPEGDFKIQEKDDQNTIGILNKKSIFHCASMDSVVATRKGLVFPKNLEEWHRAFRAPDAEEAVLEAIEAAQNRQQTPFDEIGEYYGTGPVFIETDMPEGTPLTWVRFTPWYCAPPPPALIEPTTRQLVPHSLVFPFASSDPEKFNQAFRSRFGG
jgi:hypothetical protein